MLICGVISAYNCAATHAPIPYFDHPEGWCLGSSLTTRLALWFYHNAGTTGGWTPQTGKQGGRERAAVGTQKWGAEVT